MPRCPNGSRKNKKTGKCEKVGSQKRCPKGTRKNKKTGNCEENTKKPKSVEKPKEISVEKPKEDELAVLKKELKDDYESSYRFVRSILYSYMEEYVDNMNEEKNFGGEDEDGTDIHISKREFNEFIDKNIKSIYIITKRVDNEETESDMVDRIRPFFKKVEEFIYNHEQ